MKKTLVAAVCSALAVGTALPAFAITSELTGFLRQKGIVADMQGEGRSNKNPDWLVDQRLRARYTGKVNDYLSFVYFAEVDFAFGDGIANSAAQPVGRNTGGGLDGDATSLETKNLYMIAKLPNTPLTISSGLQGFGDNWDGVLSPFFDMAGIRIDAANLGPIGTLTLGWFKLAEGEAGEASVGGQFRREDDANLWAVRFALKPMGALKLGADFYKVQNQDVTTSAHSPNGFETNGREDLYYFGPNFSYAFSKTLNLTGWAFYNFGKMRNAGLNAANAPEDVDVSAWVASAKLSASGKNWGAGARVMYLSADDDAGDSDMTSIRNPLGGQVVNNRGAVSALGAWPTFGGEGLNIMIGDATTATGYVSGATGQSAGNGFAMAEAQRGFGLLGFVVNGIYSPAAMPNLYFKGAAGYFQALEDDRKLNNAGLGGAPDAIKDHDGKVLGTELSVRVGYKIAKNLDFSLNAAQAWLGDFYKKTTRDVPVAGQPNLFAADKVDPDNPYIAYWVSTLTF